MVSLSFGLSAASGCARKARLMLLSMLVGVIAGIGAIVFFSACQVVSHYALDEAAGYRPHAPGGEPPMLKDTARPFHPWLLLIVPTLGGLVSGCSSTRFAPEAEGHGTDAAIAAYHHQQGLHPAARAPGQDRRQRHRRSGTGGSGGREGPIAQIGAGFGSLPGRLVAVAAGRAADADGRRHGRRHRRHLPCAAGRRPVRRRGAVPLAGFRVGSDHPRGLASVIVLLHLRHWYSGWQPLFRHRRDADRSRIPGSCCRTCCWRCSWSCLAMVYTRTFYG